MLSESLLRCLQYRSIILYKGRSGRDTVLAAYIRLVLCSPAKLRRLSMDEDRLNPRVVSAETDSRRQPLQTASHV